MFKKMMLALTLALSIGSVQAKPKEKVRVQHICTSKDSPENALACAMFYEARSEGYNGMLYVGNVILNRRGHEDYPDKISKVVYQRRQFSYISGRKMKVYDAKSWKLAKQAAKKLLSQPEGKRRLTDKTRGAIMFIKKGRKAYWTKKYIRTVTYKNHVFYRERVK